MQNELKFEGIHGSISDQSNILKCIFHYSYVSFWQNLFQETSERTDISSDTKSFIFVSFKFMGSNQYNVWYVFCCCCCYLFFWLKRKAVNQWSNNYSSSDKKLELLLFYIHIAYGDMCRFSWVTWQQHSSHLFEFMKDLKQTRTHSLLYRPKLHSQAYFLVKNKNDSKQMRFISKRPMYESLHISKYLNQLRWALRRFIYY